MSYDEGQAQLELNQFLKEAAAADNDDRREIAELKADKIKTVIDGLGELRGETLLSTLPKWEKREQPRLTEVVLDFRPVCSLVKMDQDFISGC